MVAKITSGVSVYGALYYNQEKVDKGKARTLAWNRIMEHPRRHGRHPGMHAQLGEQPCSPTSGRKSR